MKPETTKPAEQGSKGKKLEVKIKGPTELNDADLDGVTGGAWNGYDSFKGTEHGDFKGTEHGDLKGHRVR